MSLAVTMSDPQNRSAVERCGQWALEGCLSPHSDLVLTRIARVPFSIGRGQDVDFQLASPNVSKRHAELVFGGDLVFVRDLNSQNGTFINGHRINGPTPAGENDLIQFADLEFRLRKTTPPADDLTSEFDQPQSGWLISQMNEVVNQRRFAMHFQPIVDTATSRSVAVEALVRCRLPGLESPMQLFRAAGRLGLEERVSQLCRDEAVKTLSAHSGREDLFLNTHPREQLGPELLRELRMLREQSGDRRIVLEIHEGSITDIESMRGIRAALKDLDIGIAYDDFGAGQSRLLQLAKVPPDYLKFDRSILKNLHEACFSQQQIVRTLVEIALDDGIQPVAEGLDDQDTVEVCRDIGFTLLQGYYFARPMPVEALARFV